MAAKRHAELAETSEDVALLVAAAVWYRKKKKRKIRSCWSRDWLINRPLFGAYHCLLQELADEDTQAAKNFLRMSQENFSELLEIVGPHIQKQDTVMRQPVKSAERLAITLRYLATGLYHYHAHNTVNSLLLYNHSSAMLISK